MSVPINRRGSIPILSLSAQQKKPLNIGAQKEKPPLIRRISEDCSMLEVRINRIIFRGGFKKIIYKLENGNAKIRRKSHI